MVIFLSVLQLDELSSKVDFFFIDLSAQNTCSFVFKIIMFYAKQCSFNYRVK